MNWIHIIHYETWARLKAPGLLRNSASKRQKRSKSSKFGFRYFSQQNPKAHSKRNQATDFPGRELTESSTTDKGMRFSPAEFSLFQVCFPETRRHLSHFLVQTQKWRRCHGTGLCFPCYPWAWKGRKDEWSLHWVHSPHHQGRKVIKRPEWDASCLTSD